MRKITFALNEYYHCYNRGTDKRKIFLIKKDYLRFLALLYVCNSTKPIHVSNFEAKSLIELFSIERGDPLVAIGAYCLMPNHFHLLLKETRERGISLFMQKISIAYTMYFNIKSDRTGSLFEGTFKAEYVNVDRYLKYLFSYIHLNPVKLIEPKWKEQGIKDQKKAQEFLSNYLFSSYLDYLGLTRQQNKILSKNEFPDYFESSKDFKSKTLHWLSYGKT